MRGEERQQRSMLMVLNLEQRVPRDHPLRRIMQLAETVLQGCPQASTGCTARPAGRRFRPSACFQSLAADGALHGAQRAAVVRATRL